MRRIVHRSMFLFTSCAAFAMMPSLARCLPLFDSFLAFPSGPNPVSIVIADFNGDGHVDLITADNGGTGVVSRTLSILLGRGDGVFVPGSTITTGQTPVAVARVDITGDQEPDLVVTSQFAESVYVHPGVGGGLFGPSSRFKTGGVPGPAASGDVDGDNVLDLVVPHPYFPASISILRGLGNGVFAAPTDLLTPAYTAAVAIADLDGDHVLDLVATNTGPSFAPDSTLSVFRGLGSGAFAPAMIVPVGLAPRALAFGQFNADTMPDLAVVCPGDSTLRILVNDGLGHLSRVDLHRFDLLPPEALAVHDLDRDGIDDVVVSTSWDFTVFRGQGGGIVSRSFLGAGGIGEHSVTIGDVNEDGFDDVVVGSERTSFEGGVTVGLGAGDGTFGAPVYETPTDGLISLAIGDVDGDHHLDVVAGTYGPYVAAFLGTGVGTLSSLPLASVAPVQPDAMLLARVDADTTLDLVISGGRDGRLWIRPGNGDGTFSEGDSIAVGRLPRRLAMADFNADGHPDFVTQLLLSDSLVFVYTDGSGIIDSLWVLRAGSSGTGLGVGHIDSDPWLDVAIGTSSGGRVFWGVPGGSFGVSQSIGLPSSSIAFTLADVNDDGFLDFVAARDDFLDVRFGTGTRTFGTTVSVPTASFANQLVVADVTLDERPDILVVGNNWSSVSVHVQAPSGDFTDRLDYSVPSLPWRLAVGDFNEDTRPDLVTASTGPSSAISLMLHTGDVSTPVSGSLVTIDAGGGVVRAIWETARAGDAAMVERRKRDTPWEPRAEAMADGNGVITFLDPDVSAGTEYGYRLVLRTSAGPVAIGEAWVTVPDVNARAALAVRPNPFTGAGTVAFALPRRGNVQMQVFDVSGRLVHERSLGALDAGTHEIRWAPHLGAGLYYVRMLGAGSRAVTRVVVMR